MYVYQADTYCDSCGAAIRARIDAAGDAPADPEDLWSYDSDDYPKPADPEPTDYPDHCARGAECLEGIELGDYGLPAGATLYGAESRRIGADLSDGLTEHGAAYLAEMLAEENPTPYQRALHAYWREAFSDELSYA